MMKVRVCQDNDIDRLLTVTLLNKWGCEIVNDGEDVLITDYDLKKIKSSDGLVIVITAYEDKKDEAFMYGADYFLVKPIVNNDLKNILTKWA